MRPTSKPRTSTSPPLCTHNIQATYIRHHHHHHPPPPPSPPSCNTPTFSPSLPLSLAMSSAPISSVLTAPSLSVSRALAAYRALQRARLTAFRGDSHALEAAQVKIRQAFAQNHELSDPDAGAACEQAHAVATFLLRNVAQAVRTQENVASSTGETGDVYCITIDQNRHELHEKTPPLRPTRGAAKKCSSGGCA
ncbi:hypothetical protein H696_00779 [Fonticula alba]|uniref:Mitochondrial zinc maintenance protein 1, mitochondrial n=1 Tax=Fonticula alba TaxID=691883 RepID=A0A058ZH25_FONAL|nr:hypothetical protein H696_00779 [Fonticula alba]KCV73238.1 hypothetical protein H696_00779 [Fonticula alba]|eukprot:XP_009492939.1 hypothetical protein H696_00779 [Fonticula alba]